MQKISKKIIPIKFIQLFWETNNLNFSICSSNTFNLDMETRKILKYKKGLYRYLLPGKLQSSLKFYFKMHTYVLFEFFPEDMLCGNMNIILFNYKKYLFLNNLDILRYNEKLYTHENIKNIRAYPQLFFYCLIFYMD